MKLTENRLAKVTLVVTLGLMMVLLAVFFAFDVNPVYAGSCGHTVLGEDYCMTSCTYIGGGQWECPRKRYEIRIQPTSYKFKANAGTVPGGLPKCPSWCS